uniref:Uncharacterized protein n=1 Tax=Glossina brevipalpis TaxID=37001 RepID=A0A1A9X1W7_9MUSC
MARLNAVEEAKAKKLAEDVPKKEQTLTKTVVTTWGTKQWTLWKKQILTKSEDRDTINKEEENMQTVINLSFNNAAVQGPTLGVEHQPNFNSIKIKATPPFYM